MQSLTQAVASSNQRRPAILPHHQAGIVRELIAQQFIPDTFSHAVTVSFVADRSPKLARDVEANRIPKAHGATDDKNRRKAMKRHEMLSLPLYERDAAIGERLVRAYFNAMRKALCRYQSLPAIGVRETLERNGRDSIYLHYHCLLGVPGGQESLFETATKEFWYDKGWNRFGAPIACHIQPAGSMAGAISYALKNVGNDYPIDQIIMVGLDDGPIR